MKHTRLTLALAAGLAGAATSNALAAVTIDWVAIGNPGNAPQSPANRLHIYDQGDGFGAVGYNYSISRNETTIAQYADFLNAVATTDPYNLYNPNMASNGNIAGVARTGSPGSYSYSVIGSGNRPITYVSWFDAARFANWLHNGQQTGPGAALTAEDGAYTLLGATSGIIAKNVGATIWIPGEDEWFKAAYYDPTHMSGAGGYWFIGVPGAANHWAGDYATTPGSQTYSPTQNYLTEAGAYGPGSQSYYGINDMAGNVWEWTDGVEGSSRVMRGGTYTNGAFSVGSASRFIFYPPTSEDPQLGFRLASIPEPATTVLTLLFGSMLLRRRRR